MHDDHGVESIAVHAEIDADENYETLISYAMSRVKTFLPDATLLRSRGECGGGMLGAGEEWYVACVHGEVSHGGQSMAATVSFVRYKED